MTILGEKNVGEICTNPFGVSVVPRDALCPTIRAIGATYFVELIAQTPRLRQGNLN
jgi:hypothetical protein